MSNDPRRRDPAINWALRALNLPPLLTGSEPDPDAEPMSRGKAALIVAAYTALYSPMLVFFVAWSLHGAPKF
jgi:hypothetical protein